MTFDVPASCTLPTAEQPVRVAEFAELFASTLTDRQRVDDRNLRLILSGGETVAARVRDLVARETRCCAFFEFVVTGEGDRVLLDVAVPAVRTGVLDGLVELADRSAR